jgi:hypothetical protein
MRNTDQTSNGFDKGNMLQHHQLREVVVKKTGGEGSLNYLSIPKDNLSYQMENDHTKNH